MGLKSNYNKFINKVSEDKTKNTIHLSTFQYKKMAIDTTLFLYKFKAVFGDNWLNGFIQLIKCLRTNIIHCVFIFDGQAPSDKTEEQLRRKNDKLKLINNLRSLETSYDHFKETNTVTPFLLKHFDSPHEVCDHSILKLLEKKKKQIIDITPLDFDTLKKFLDACGIPWIVAAGEAEKLCCKLCLDKVVDCVLSDDTDILAYKCPVALSKIDTFNETVNCIEHDSLLEFLGLNEDEFLDHCILCGTDYNQNIPNIGSFKAYNLIKQFKNIENIQKYLQVDMSNINYLQVRKLFTVFEQDDIRHVDFCAPPNHEKLQELFKDLNRVFNIKDFIFDVKLNFIE